MIMIMIILLFLGLSIVAFLIPRLMKKLSKTPDIENQQFKSTMIEMEKFDAEYEILWRRMTNIYREDKPKSLYYTDWHFMKFHPEHENWIDPSTYNDARGQLTARESKHRRFLRDWGHIDADYQIEKRNKKIYKILNQ